MRRTTVPPSPPASPPERPLRLRPSGMPSSARANVFVLAVGLGIAFFLAMEPTQPWILLLVTGLTALGTGAVLRTEAPAPPIDAEGRASALSDTVFSLIVPVLWVFGAGLLAEYVAEGFWSLPVALGIALGFGTIVYAEITSLDPEAETYQGARLALNVAAYVIAFALFAAPYAADLDRLPSALFVGVAAVLMSIELMREAPLSPAQVLVLAGTAGLLLAESRWTLHFLPLDEFLAATLLLLVFYVATGVLQSQLLARLTASAALEYGAVAATGLLLIIAADMIA